MSYDVATWANTSSNQAIKDLGQLRRGYSNLVKFIVFYVIKSVAVKSVAATLVAARTESLPGSSRFPISSDQSKKWRSAQPTNRPSSPLGTVEFEIGFIVIAPRFEDIEHKETCLPDLSRQNTKHLNKRGRIYRSTNTKFSATLVLFNYRILYMSREVSALEFSMSMPRFTLP
jgi:hypothetical protein